MRRDRQQGVGLRRHPNAPAQQRGAFKPLLLVRVYKVPPAFDVRAGEHDRRFIRTGGRAALSRARQRGGLDGAHAALSRNGADGVLCGASCGAAYKFSCNFVCRSAIVRLSAIFLVTELVMPEVDLDNDVFEYLQSEAQPFIDTPSTVLRRLLKLNGTPNGAGTAGSERRKSDGRRPPSGRSARVQLGPVPRQAPCCPRIATRFPCYVLSSPRADGLPTGRSSMPSVPR